jgi:hypothetical protein
MEIVRSVCLNLDLDPVMQIVHLKPLIRDVISLQVAIFAILFHSTLLFHSQFRAQ